MSQYEDLEAECIDVQIKQNSKLDIYVGQVRQTKDHAGNEILCVVKSIDKLKVKDGCISFDTVYEPIGIVTKA